ncbi:MAG: PEP-utilizing enzyme, partial [Bacteroidota bacterium]
TYSQEDGEVKSFAGHYSTLLNVGANQFENSIRDVFNSYPKPENQQVIVQQMLQPQYSGVLFAFRKGVWKIEFGEGLGENIVSGKSNPFVLLLPKFKRSDTFFCDYYKFWNPFPHNNLMQQLIKPFIELSLYTARLLKFYSKNDIGIDIEFAVENGSLYLLQARPITTKEEKEEVLTSANHKEILPNKPSRSMTSLIADAKKDLFGYYKNLDPTLEERNFIETAQGMPWINLSALLDIMVAWGLPTSLVCKSVGAEDFYQVQPRPYIILTKLKVFFNILLEQIRVKNSVKKWKKNTFEHLDAERAKRKELWEIQPIQAFESYYRDLKKLYVGLVSNMQQLTGAMSGPVSLLHKLGVLQKSNLKSKSTEYLQAFHQLAVGKISKADFLEQFGFRGFYESDIGQPRFYEYTSEQWETLLKPQKALPKTLPHKKGNFLLGLIARPIIQLIHTREALRHDTMQQFWFCRNELQTVLKSAFPKQNIQFETYYFNDLKALFSKAGNCEKPEYEAQAGWSSDTFLNNVTGRSLPIETLINVSTQANSQTGIGIYPGVVTGTVWRVKFADFTALNIPDYEHIILVADSLDPGWIPYFGSVKGVISYVGGVLSHASIILRESKIPSITQLPQNIELQEGDTITMDGKSGDVKKL